MPYEEGTHYCETCGKQVLTRRATANHVLHLLITSLSCFFWIPIWVLLAMSPGGWRCVFCGRVLARSSNALQAVVVAFLAFALFGATGAMVAIAAKSSGALEEAQRRARAAIAGDPHETTPTATAAPSTR